MTARHSATLARSRLLLLTGTALAAIPLLSSSAAQAQSVWGGAGSTTTTTDYNLATNWSNPPAGAPPVAGGQSALLGDTGTAAVNVTSAITPDAWTFGANAQNYVVTGQAVDFGIGLTNNASAAQAISIANNLTGTSLLQAGASTLTLSGTNAFTTTSVTAGTLVNSGTLTGALTNSATFNNSGTVTGTFGNSGTANISGGALNGAVTNNGTFNVTGAATSTGTFSNVSAGATTTIGTNGNYQATDTFTNTGTVTIDNGGTLAVTGGSQYFSNDAGTSTINGTLTATNLRITGGTVFLNQSTGAFVSFSAGGAGSPVLDISNAASGITTAGLRSTGGVAGTVNLGANTLTISPYVTSQSFIGTIQGSGGITVAGNGYLNLGNGSVGAYTGATTVSGMASLYIGSQNAIAASSMLDVTSDATFVRVDRNANIRSLQGVAGATIFLRANLNITDATRVFNGVLNDDDGAGSKHFGLTLTGGRQTLGGVNAYTGATNVNGGTLSVNGSIAASSLTTVNAGGALGGTGTVGNTTINGGTLAPGNSIGTLNVQGNLVFTAASSYMVEVSPTNADRVNVSGTATLGGATVTASFASAPGAYVSKQYTILDATGGRAGTFGALVNTNLPSNITSALSYDANHAYLDLTLAFVPPPAGPTAPVYTPLDANQRTVGSALVNYFNSTGGIPLVFATLTPAGLTQVSGETATGSQQTSFDAMNQFMSILNDPASEGRGSSGNAAPVAFADETMAYAAKRRPSDALAAIYRKAPPMAPGFVPSWSVWAAGFGGAQTTDGNATTGSATATSRIYGTAVGADFRFSPDTIAGFALAGGGTSFSVANAGTGRSDLFQAGAFIRHTMGPAYLSAALAYGSQDVTTDRAIGFDRLQGRFSANAFSGRVEGGTRFATAWMGVTPYAAAQVTTLDLPGYGETAVGANTFALNYGGRTVTAPRSELGVRTDRSFALNNALLTLRGRAAWAHDYNTDRSAAATFQTLPGASFVVNGARPVRDAALATAQAEMKWATGWSVAATFEGEFSDVTRSYAGKGSVRYAW